MVETGETTAAAPAPVQSKMQAKLSKMESSVRMGGKGTMRRKKKAVHRAAPTDDKRLQATIKRMGLTQISGIEEVNLFRDNGQVTNFLNPKGKSTSDMNTSSGRIRLIVVTSSDLSYLLNTFLSHSASAYCSKHLRDFWYKSNETTSGDAPKSYQPTWTGQHQEH